MSKITDGGQAFPVMEHDNYGNPVADHMGLTVRDYFAAKALQGFCANPAVFAANGMRGWGLVNTDEQQLSEYCVQIANAMIAECAK